MRHPFPTSVVIRRSLAVIAPALLLLTFPGAPRLSARDCNRNGIEDSFDIDQGSSRDCNQNGAPDECDLDPAGIGWVLRPGIPLPPSFGLSLAVADMDGDRIADFVVNEYSADKVWVLRRDGAGELLDPVPVATGGSGSYQIGMADLNGDGRMDLVVSTYSFGIGGFTVSVVLSDGLGSFLTPELLPRPHGAVVFFDLADLDGDRDLDIATGSSAGDGFVLWQNDGAGRFEGHGLGGVASNVVQVLARDLDGDGDVDLGYLEHSSHSFALLENLGSFAFSMPRSYTAGFSPFSLTAADFDRDGDLDLSFANGNPGQVQLLTNLGAGNFVPSSFATESPIRFLIAADLDEDDLPDLAAVVFEERCQRLTSRLSVFRGAGDGSFLRPLDYPMATEAYGFIAADLGGDGLTDFVALRVSQEDQTKRELLVFNAGRGALSKDEHLDGVLDECESPPGDCNWNGKPDSADLATGTSGDCNRDSLPDECQPDCNRNGAPDDCDIAAGISKDEDTDGIPDDCGFAALDCNANGQDDALDIQAKTSGDCNLNGIPDDCDVMTRYEFLSGTASRAALGFTPGPLVLADLDGDGDTDMAVAARGDCCAAVPERGGIAVLLNQGEAKLAYAGTHAMEGDPRSVAAADVDGDRDLDLIVAASGPPCRPAATVMVLTNGGGGAFERGESFLLPANPASIATGDLDLDGDVDLAIGIHSPFPRTVLLYLGGGQGDFRLAGGVGPRGGAASTAMTDWDGDGLLDIALLDRDGSSLRILLNDQGNSFRRQVDLLIQSYSLGALAVGDLDGDGDPDLVTASNYPGSPSQLAWVYRNMGPGNPPEVLSTPTRIRIGHLALGDVNRDGRVDILAAGSALVAFTGDGPGAVSVLINLGGGVFVESERFFTGSALQSFAAGDLDGDGHVDAVAADGPLKALTIHRNNQNGGFELPYTYPVGSGVRSVAAGDLDGDGDQDLVTANEASDDVTVLWNERGVFEAARLTTGVPFGPRSVATSDFDRDGDADFAVAGRLEIGLLFSGAQRKFTAAESLIVGSDPMALAPADLDGDGDVDLTSLNLTPDGLPDNVSIFLNGGSGEFGLPRNYAVGVTPFSVTTGDLDGDADLDLAVANSFDSTISILLNAGDGTFLEQREILTQFGADFVRAADADRDGDIDLVLANAQGIFVLKNSGAATFEQGEPVVTRIVLAVETRDMDGDLDADIVFTADGWLWVVGNRGDGSFFEPVFFDINPAEFVQPLPVAGQGGGEQGGGGSGDPTPVDPTANALAVADFDGDGDRDVALSFVEKPAVAIAFNKTVLGLSDGNKNGVPDECESNPSRLFRRADPNQDAKADISDAIIILRHLFVTGEPIACRKAADANDDSRVDLSDAVTILRFLFVGAEPPPPPYPDCGPDPTPDLGACETYGRC